jgi:DNA invertase Pin-like site-specific DNA recombinase
MSEQNRKNAVAYLRVANFCDAKEVLRLQRAKIESFCEREGYIVQRFYEDIGSGLNLEREGLTEMQARIAKGGTDAILTNSFDRITRNYVHLLSFQDFMNETGVDLVSVKEGSLREIQEKPSLPWQALMETAMPNEEFLYDEDLEDEL